ncbi:FAD-dependent oxidoreductase [Vulcanimicrobium alpinum]|uniref:Pyridine nucleotide-disulfide oxidoreductase domain-containing protein 2 n=1 Tax=Vulcanimicrobium alpinum TaxID=3016050 RepID=A0AAN1XVM9_UNVUL|nr:NAD(P)/FAD-dependent oxidoreductase [Vulcanimicrobium alpinum]BDE05830.1 FAD-dependent oxidoreductase [Vulcanimicrobium alpinum]
MATTYDAIIIGGGHNGLVTACYLARAKWKVLLLERRYLVGGACVTEERTFPGFKVSTAAYVNSLFRPEIIRDLRLKDYGFEVVERNPSSFSPFPDGRYLMLGPDEAMNEREIAKFSARDAAAYPQYVAMLERVATVIEPTLVQTPPNPVRPGMGDLIGLGQLGLKLKKLDGAMGEAIEILTGAARPILDRWFESEELKATLATDAIIGAFAAPSVPGTAYVLFHHVMGETNGARGVWSYVRGGMGGLSQALEKAARDLGVQIRTEAEVTKILVEDNAATGVVLANGDEYRARNVASGVDCRLTFERFLEPSQLPEDFLAEIKRIDYGSASAKINVALDALPNFTACPGSEAGPQHRGTIHLCPDQDFIERGYDDAKYGRWSREPIVECTIPSSVDATVAPPGKHLMSMFCQYAPYHLKDGSWDDAAKNAFADACFAQVERYAPGFTSSMIDRQVLSPLDIESTFNLTGGNIFQGAMGLNKLFMFRPAPGWADYKTPVRRLFLCGAAAHPGGGVMGAAGWNAARVMLKGR